MVDQELRKRERELKRTLIGYECRIDELKTTCRATLFLAVLFALVAAAALVSIATQC